MTIMEGWEKEGRLAALEANVRYLLDIEEIRNIRRLYHTYVNERTPERIADLFTNDGEWDFGPVSRGSNVREYFTNLKDRSQFFQQFPHHHVVEVTGDLATGFCYQEAKAVINGIAYTVLGRYDDVYHRTPAGWRFRKMCFDPRVFAPSSDQSWADPAKRRVDPYANFMERDADGNLIIPKS
ncbi:nuclear transport factor 2 family protein [Novosphingobium malaysiense]|uniref:SnoaL-like domain-containing protein n=1 Tax=Novosphingobium malaysiense TaxID=1348853 RepID=A0A0B1ZMB9_9SPHN|nr:nuclear transport factor 2 family protein [Novosphingobium malaysiense]KHK90338.1 hypothetical protein LK12_17165 [Novosphingobium malaysiense]